MNRFIQIAIVLFGCMFTGQVSGSDKARVSNKNGLTAEQIQAVMNFLPHGCITEKQILEMERSDGEKTFNYSIDDIKKMNEDEKLQLTSFLKFAASESEKDITILTGKIGSLIDNTTSGGLIDSSKVVGLSQEIVESQKGDECGMRTLGNIRNSIARFLFSRDESEKLIEKTQQYLQTCDNQGSNLSSENIIKEWNEKYSQGLFGDKKTPLVIVSEQDYVFIDVSNQDLLSSLCSDESTFLEKSSYLIVSYLLNSNQKGKAVFPAVIRTGRSISESTHWFGLVFFKHGSEVTATVVDSLGIAGNISRLNNNFVKNIYAVVKSEFLRKMQQEGSSKNSSIGLNHSNVNNNSFASNPYLISRSLLPSQEGNGFQLQHSTDDKDVD